jgi:hypothetical protein
MGQQAGFVEIGVVGPAVQRRKTECSRTRATATVRNAVRACAVPRHADKERSVVSVIGGPPRLRAGHQRNDVFFHCRQIQRKELFFVIKIRFHRVGKHGILAQNIQAKLVRPPIVIACAAACGLLQCAVHKGAFCYVAIDSAMCVCAVGGLFGAGFLRHCCGDEMMVENDVDEKTRCKCTGFLAENLGRNETK